MNTVNDIIVLSLRVAVEMPTLKCVNGTGGSSWWVTDPLIEMRESVNILSYNVLSAPELTAQEEV